MLSNKVATCCPPPRCDIMAAYFLSSHQLTLLSSSLPLMASADLFTLIHESCLLSFLFVSLFLRQTTAELFFLRFKPSSISSDWCSHHYEVKGKTLNKAIRSVTSRNCWLTVDDPGSGFELPSRQLSCELGGQLFLKEPLRRVL